jgi:hypothetical protein
VELSVPHVTLLSQLVIKKLLNLLSNKTNIFKGSVGCSKLIDARLSQSLS